ncbi:C40 family peptidase [Dactylosporangium roseum]|uniref:C40 family peptidase n=1 Tax=Dactylosporangium roseum TaxID=47989 RepID=A0ABY5YUM1_9ACTN|nr:C40 family peptidase [Dactylosporangium roseum]UWZ33425.1 C40 family peptidase [Dactylosporangium roseum]
MTDVIARLCAVAVVPSITVLPAQADGLAPPDTPAEVRSVVDHESEPVVSGVTKPEVVTFKAVTLKNGGPDNVPKTGPVTVPTTGRAAVVISYALAQVGKPYKWGSAGPGAYDCSGLVMASYAKAGIKLPHQSGQIPRRGRKVHAGQWQPGDVIAFPGHVALYLGGNRMVEAANKKSGVRIAPTRGGTAYRFL